MKEKVIENDHNKNNSVNTIEFNAIFIWPQNKYSEHWLLIEDLISIICKQLLDTFKSDVNQISKANIIGDFLPGI